MAITTRRRLGVGVEIWVSATDPNTSTYSADVGTLCLYQNVLYIKKTSSSTSWEYVNINSVTAGTPVALTPDQANAVGSSTQLARADHIHTVATAVPGDVGSANAQGTAVTFVRSDHTHRGIRSLKANAAGTQRFGDIILAATNNELEITDNGTGTFSFENFNFSNFEDFDFNAFGRSANPYDVLAITGSGGAATLEAAVASNDYLGMTVLTTGTGGGAGWGGFHFFNGVAKLRLGGVKIVYEARVRIPALSTAPTAFQVWVGMQDTSGQNLPANGIYFTYSHSINTGQWRGTTTAASTSTNVDSTIAIIAATWYKLRCVIAANRSSVQFFVNGVSIGSSTTNIPATTTGLSFYGQILETFVAGVNREFDVDYIYWRMER